MRKKYVFMLAAFIAFFALTAGIMNSGGSPGAKTGSPGDMGNDCTQCHGGTASFQAGWITSSIPGSGYVPGNTYTLTATGTHTQVSMFGFELTAEDSLNNKIGSFAITNNQETKLANSGNSVTHKAAGTTPSNNSKSWSVNWTAPANYAGNISFYAAFNAANGNQATSGDVIYNSTLMVTPNTTALEELSKGISLNIYPNPASESLFIQNYEDETIEVRMFDQQGKVVFSEKLKSNSNRFDISTLSQGIYYIKANTHAKTYKILVR